MSPKEQAIAVVNGLPEPVTWAQAIDALALGAARDQAEQQIARGEGLPGDQVEQRIADTLKHFSPPNS